jgi:DNA modification methylase
MLKGGNGERAPINKLYYGDNLHWLEKMPPATADLIYLDPPFNSQSTYNILYHSPDGEASQAQYQAFEDSWSWDKPADIALAKIMTSGSPAAEIISSLHNYMQTSDLMAYLVMMTARLIELRRVLKPTGSLYLHCDPGASHYLKIILDAVFLGGGGFRNEVIWKRTGSHGGARRWGPVHDTILFYSASSDYTWNRVFQEYDPQYLDDYYRFSDERGRYRLVTLTGAGTRTGDSGKPWRDVDPTDSGRHWAVPMRALQGAYPNKDLRNLTTQEKLDLLNDAGLVYWPTRGSVPQQKRYSTENPGVLLQDIISDIRPISSHSQERLNYQTQKPIALLQRIIEASSNIGETVLDPFCGCGTAIEAAQLLERKWIGIDITPLAIDVVERRLSRRGVRRKFDYLVEGVPLDMDGAHRLYESDPLHLHYQLWALTLVDGQPREGGKPGADKGVDGVIYFQDDARTIEKATVSVKGGKNVHAQDVRDLIGTMNNQRAKLGVLVTMHKTRAMEEAARDAGSIEAGGKMRRRVQIATIEDLLEGRKPDLPPVHDIISAAAAARRARSVREVELTPEELRESPQFKYPITGGKKARQQDLPLPEPLLTEQPATRNRRRRSV